MNVLREIVNRPFLERFNTKFMENIKNCLRSQLLFSFSIKKFLKIVSKLIF